MRKINKSMVALMLIIVMIVSSIVPVSAADTQPTKYSTTNNSGERHVVCTTLEGTGAASYYTGSYTYDNLEELSADRLLTTLRGLMTSTHKYKSSYANCRDYANRTDCENGSGTNIVTIYTSYSSSHSEYDGGSGWNREHVWPKSLGGFNQDGAGADLHHIRPSENRTNSDRGNLKYGEVNGGSVSKGNLSGEIGGYKGSYYEPLDEVKGDVARICLYVYVRYGTEYSKCSSITNVFQSVDVLLDWCELDPVDTWEMGRNEVVGAIQGNRNVFIDYPELAWLIFDREVPTDMVTPSGEAMSGSSGGNQGGNQGGTTECTHEITELKNTIEPTCIAGGYEGDCYCKSCGELLSYGKILSAKGHSWGEWQLDEDGMNMIRSCSLCSFIDSERAPGADCTHSDVEIRNAENATCGDPGYTGDTYCLSCERLVAKGSLIPSNGKHNWSEMQIITPPTDTTAGEGSFTCVDCGMIRSIKLQPETELDVIVDTISWNVVYAILESYLNKA